MTITLAVVGGKLQGTEAVYLARKAGFKTLLLDKDISAPASGLCDEFLAHEFAEGSPLPDVLPDLILPAIEDDGVLARIRQWAKARKIPLAFDFKAYSVSCSKLKSDALFERLHLPAPRYWPHCSFPVVVKPDQASGSQGVEIFFDPAQFKARFPEPGAIKNTVIQEYLQGPSHSIEIIGQPGDYRCFQVTDLGMDEVYDCNRVTAPTQLPSGQTQKMEAMAVKIAKALDLKGIMDLEVICHGSDLKLLEIDARLPSQTPMTVFHSRGVNMVSILADLFLEGSMTHSEEKERPVRVEHIRVKGAEIEFSGEHIMGLDGPLHLEKDFFGADEAITSFSPGKSQWVATLVFTADSIDDIIHKRNACLGQIAALF